MAEKLYYGPLWPLGYVAPAYSGAGEALTHELTGALATTEYTEDAAMGVIISPAHQTGSTWVANTGPIFLCTKNALGEFNAVTDPGTVVAVIKATDPPFIMPLASYCGNRLRMSDLGIDIQSSGDGAFVCGIMQ